MSTYQTTAATAQSTEVAITSTAQQLASLEQQLAGTPEIDPGRVAAVSQALANGTYQINAGRIADGLLSAQKFDAQASAGAAPANQSNSLKAFTATAQLGADKH